MLRVVSVSPAAIVFSEPVNYDVGNYETGIAANLSVSAPQLADGGQGLARVPVGAWQNDDAAAGQQWHCTGLFSTVRPASGLPADSVFQVGTVIA